MNAENISIGSGTGKGGKAMKNVIEFSDSYKDVIAYDPEIELRLDPDT